MPVLDAIWEGPTPAIFGALLIVVILWEAFETIVLPRRVTRRFRFAVLFYRTTWMVWRFIAVRLPRRGRELMLSFYGPLSLLSLVAAWAITLVTGFALLQWGLGSGLDGPRTFLHDFYYSGTTFFTLGLGDFAPLTRAAKLLTVLEAATGFAFLALMISYRNSVSGLGGWGDGDSVFTNYVAHPMQGAVTGFIQIQNDPGGRKQEFDWNPDYWKSRVKAMGWAALYSTQFELGPLSEASLGNVGRKRGTMGFVDLVMTPVGGMGLIVAEDALDKKWIERLEGRTGSLNRRRMYRMFLNPQRTFANLLRLKKPWHRDTRRIDWSPADKTPVPPAPAPAVGTASSPD